MKKPLNAIQRYYFLLEKQWLSNDILEEFECYFYVFSVSLSELLIYEKCDQNRPHFSFPSSLDFYSGTTVSFWDFRVLFEPFVLDWLENSFCGLYLFRV